MDAATAQEIMAGLIFGFRQKNSREQNSKLKQKTQEFGILLLPKCRNDGQKTSLVY